MFTRLCLGALLLSATTVQAQNEPYYLDQVTGFLQRHGQAGAMTNLGFKRLQAGLRHAYVPATSGSARDVSFYVEAGYAYAFLGVCDEDCRDVDLTVYDAQGTKVAENLASDDQPAVWFLAARSGEYRVRVTTPQCLAPLGCYVGVQALFK